MIIQTNAEPIKHSLIDNLKKEGTIRTFEAGTTIIEEHDYIKYVPIVISGSIRVYQKKRDREILLYYVEPGQTCMMSLSSAYFDYNSAAYGMATEPTEILVVPAKMISEWQLKYPSWNRYIIQTFKSRYDELLTSFGKVVFDPIPVRLKEYLIKVAKSVGSKIRTSHQNLANELGTTRVVISRILKQFEKENILKLHRGFIEMR